MCSACELDVEQCFARLAISFRDFQKQHLTYIQKLARKAVPKVLLPFDVLHLEGAFPF